MEYTKDLRYRLSTGRVFEAGANAIGITPNLDVSVGYDSTMFQVHPDAAADQDYEPHEVWTAEERAELADFMIAQWQRFKDRDRPAPLTVHTRRNPDGSVNAWATDPDGNRVDWPGGTSLNTTQVVYYEDAAGNIIQRTVPRAIPTQS